jgi:predicted DNA-binding transcriptional regulator AlpA
MMGIGINKIELIVGQYMNRSRVLGKEIQLDFFNEVKELKPALTDDEFCLLIGITRKTLNNKLSKGCSLPNYIRIPGGRSRLWPTSEIASWLSESQEAKNENV